MKQVYQNLKTGKLMLEDVPTPALGAGMVLVRVAASLVSAGTERTMVDFAQKSLLAKARSRPDLVRQVIGKAQREGVLAAFTAASQKLDRPQPLGYSCAGTVIAVAEDVTSYRVGDRVACAGAGYANHAEVVAVPVNLVAPIPAESVSMEDAAFTTVGAIAMQGLRLAVPTFGETIAVIGLGLVGLLTVELANAAGCTVVGMDPNPARCALAEKIGCSVAVTNAGEFEAVVATRTASNGADAVVITAASESSAPVELAGAVARHRAKVVAVGLVGTTLPRKTYFEKELEFVVSRSYGPGRYDPSYEEKGHDYPISYVRWTENRNMQAFLNFLASGKLDLKPLISHRFPITEVARAYEVISGAAKEPFLGVVLGYDATTNETPAAIPMRTSQLPSASGAVRIGLLGSGNFAHAVLLPALKQSGEYVLTGICTSTGPTARHAAQKFGFQYCTTENERIFADPAVDAVVIATRHNLHAKQVISALRAGKHVFCEKPLCLSIDELIEIASVYGETRSSHAPQIMVGFNRRFAPMVVQLRQSLAAAREPVVVQCRVNGGRIPLKDWIQDPQVGGGRIIGEVCHFVDLMQYLTDSNIVRVYAAATPDNGRYSRDNFGVLITFADGSIGNLTYVASGDKSMGKERVEAFSGGMSAVIDDYRVLEIVRNGRRRSVRDRLRQQKGHLQELSAFAAGLRSGIPAIPFESICATTLCTFAIHESLSSGVPVEISVASLFDGGTDIKATLAAQYSAE